MKKKLLVISWLFLLTTNQIAAQATVEKKQIAPNFPEFKGVLLILKNDVLTSKIERKFEKSYKGKFQMVEEGELKTKQYNDVKTYPFIVYCKFDGVTSSTTFYAFEMEDRTTGKTYRTARYPDNTIPPFHFITKYIKALNKARGENDGE